MNKKNIILTSVILLILVVIVIIYLLNRTCTVTFVAKIGPGIMPANVKIGEKVEEPNIYSVDGYIFLGWFLDDAKYDFNTPVTKNITLEAKWQEKN